MFTHKARERGRDETWFRRFRRFFAQTTPTGRRPSKAHEGNIAAASPSSPSSSDSEDVEEEDDDDEIDFPNYGRRASNLSMPSSSGRDQTGARARAASTRRLFDSSSSATRDTRHTPSVVESGPLVVRSLSPLCGSRPLNDALAPKRTPPALCFFACGKRARVPYPTRSIDLRPRKSPMAYRRHTSALSIDTALLRIATLERQVGQLAAQRAGEFEVRLSNLQKPRRRTSTGIGGFSKHM